MDADHGSKTYDRGQDDHKYNNYTSKDMDSQVLFSTSILKKYLFVMRYNVLMQPRVFVTVSDPYLPSLRPFIYLFQIYWSTLQPVVVIGFNRPNYDLPGNFQFYSASFPDRGKHSWSTVMIEFLNKVDDDRFVLLLEDYWLSRTVDHQGIRTLSDYMAENKDVFRVDLSNDVLHCRGDGRNAPEKCSYGHYDMIYKTPDLSYRMSLQAALWDRKKMLQVLKPGQSSWEVELHDTPPEDWDVMGTRQWPVRYINAINKGSIDHSEIDKLPEEHRERVRGMVPVDFRIPDRK